MRRFLRWVGTLMPAGMIGAFVALGVRLGAAEQNRLGLLVVGWLYGVGVVGLIRLFRVAPWGYPFVGAICCPVPAALLVVVPGMEEQEGVGTWVVLAIGGVVVGFVEWARLSRDVRRSGA